MIRPISNAQLALSPATESLRGSHATRTPRQHEGGMTSAAIRSKDFANTKREASRRGGHEAR